MVAVLALVLGISAHTHAPSPTRLSGGDPVEPIAVNFVNGLSNSQVFDQAVQFSMASGTNQVSWKNQTGRLIYVDDYRAWTTAVASTSMIYSVGTSTTATVTDATPASNAPLFGGLIDRFTLATSTPIIVINSGQDKGTLGRSVIAVQPGQYLVSIFESTWPSFVCNGNSCEAATSTNRGFNIGGYFHYHY